MLLTSQQNHTTVSISIINQCILFHRKSKKDAGKNLASMINSDDNSEKENVCNDSDDVFA